MDIKEDYLFFSSLELIEYFSNNLAEKDIKTQSKRIFEMAKVYMKKQDFELEDVYSLLVMVKDMNDRPVINEVIRLYFNEGSYPIRVIIQIGELESTSDVEIEFSAFRGEKTFINTGSGHLPTGPFSQGVILDGHVHCSGARPLDPMTQKVEADNVGQQTRQCLENLNTVLKAASSDLSQAYAFMIYLKDLGVLPEVEAAFLDYSLSDDALKEVTQIEELNEGHRLEISCSAKLIQ